MADFEGPAALTQAAASLSASGDAVNPGGTQAVGVVLASGNVVYTGTAALSQAACAVSASGTMYNYAGIAALAQAAHAMAASGSTGPAIEGAITQAACYVSGSGEVYASGSVTPATLAAQQALASRRDIQLPRIPTSVPKDAQDWFLAAQKIIDKYIFGSDGSRLVSINDLTKAGIADRDGSGVRPPAGNLTTPPKVTGLRADGALASIIIAWKNPSFANYSHTELWRASVDDLGQAVNIQETPVESYVDMVGSGSTKFYWARAVSKAGVAGDFNAAAGTKGVTGYDPTYVRDLMTSATWKPVTPYGAYQYVRPTTPNGYQYACIDGGRSGGDEPAWPTTVGDTVSDADIVWQCVAADARVPFVIGADPNGDPAVYIDTAYIEDATITSAKIGDLVADKITTGNLLANIQLLSKLWYGFEEYGNPGFAPGLWIGSGGDGLPRLHLSCGGDPDLPTTRFLNFDGNELRLQVDIASGADIHADDLTADSADLRRANIDFLSVTSFVTPSDWVNEAAQPITIGDPEYENFLCYATGCRLTASHTSALMIIGTGYSRPYALCQTGYYTGVVPYDHSDASTKYRCRTKNIACAIKISVNGASLVPYGVSYMDVYILNQDQNFKANNYNASTATEGVPANYLAKMNLTGCGDTVQAVQNLSGSDVDIFTADVDIGASSILITIYDDEEALNYVSGQSLKVGVAYKMYWEAGSKDDDTIYRVINVDFQISTMLQLDVADNDPALEP